MREKVEGARDEVDIRGKAERTRVSTKTKAKTEALDTAKTRYEDEAKEITQMGKATIKSKVRVEDKGIERMRAGAKARENVKSEVKQNGKGDMKTLGLIAVEGIERDRARAEANMPSNNKIW